MKIPAQKYLPVPKAGRLQAGGAGVRGGEARGERRGGFAPPEASGDPRPRAPRRRLASVPGAQGGRRDLPQSRVSGWALGMSAREYTAPKWSRLIRKTFLQTMSCRRPRAPGFSRPPPPPSEPSTPKPTRISSLAVRKGIFPSSAAEPGMAGERRALVAAAASRRAAGVELSGGGDGFCLLGGDFRTSRPRLPGASLLPSLFFWRSARLKGANLGARHLLLASRPYRCWG